QIRGEAPPPVSDSNPGVPAELEAIVRQCLAKQPELRYASSDAVADDLDRWLAGDPVTAPPVEAVPAVPVPLPPLRRKFPRWVMFAATVVLLGGVMAAVFLWPRPDPPKRTIAERISAGQPLTIIGSKGRP